MHFRLILVGPTTKSCYRNCGVVLFLSLLHVLFIRIVISSILSFGIIILLHFVHIITSQPDLFNYDMHELFFFSFFFYDIIYAIIEK